VQRNADLAARQQPERAVDPRRESPGGKAEGTRQVEAGGELSPEEFSRNWRVQIQNDIYRQVAVEKTRESISGNNHQVRCLKPDDAFGNAGELQG